MDTTWRAIVGLLAAAAILALVLYGRGTINHGPPMPSHPMAEVSIAA